MNLQNFEPMKIYNFRGEKLKEIEQSNDCTFFVDTYYDVKLSKNFIITGNYNYIKTYDFDKNEIYHKYFENNNGIHPNVIIKHNEEKIKLIESCEDGIIRMWGFHSGNLLRKIQTDNNNLYGICLCSLCLCSIITFCLSTLFLLSFKVKICSSLFFFIGSKSECFCTLKIS